LQSWNLEGFIFCSSAGAVLYVNIVVNVLMSLYFGVNPALTTLSEAAIHSTTSRDVSLAIKQVCASRNISMNIIGL